MESIPIITYTMNKLPSLTRPAGATVTAFDIEQPPPISPATPPPAEPFFDPSVRMPALTDPNIISEMRSTVADVSQTRSILKQLGPRPDHESVDTAKARLAEIEVRLANDLDEINLSESDGEDSKKEAEKDKEIYKAVIALDELHETYGKVLAEAEAKLERIYAAAVAGHGGGDEVAEGSEEVNEDVVRILQEANQKDVERIDLSDRGVRFLPEAFGKIRTLVALNLSVNQLQLIPDSIAGLENLEELNLSSNMLESLPESIGLLLNLKTLDVSSNKLTALPDSICHCRSLVELNASFNKLTYLPTNIGYELVNLRRLSIQLNKIRTLPTSIGEMNSLQFLDVHFNELQGLPHSVGKLTNLESINLSSNFSDLKELPETFGDLINLQELDISNNQIHALPNTFGQLKKLRTLNLEENPIVIPPKEIVNSGVEAVKAYMAQRRVDLLAEEEARSKLEASEETPLGWLTRSTSWLKNSVVGATQSVSGYMGAHESNRDPAVNQQY
ncbi:hypothetical protein ACET3Z_017220 [Daucus carota]